MKRTACALKPVYVLGCGMSPVTRQRDVAPGPSTRIEEMGGAAVREALADADIDPLAVQGLYVGNMMSGMLSQQQHVAPLLATAAGLHSNPDTVTAESCCGAGGAALRLGYMAIKSGMADTVVVAGVEEMTRTSTPETTSALATASHWANEGSKGETFLTLNGALQKLYLETYGALHGAEPGFSLGHFSVNAHRNAMTATHSFLKKPIDLEGYETSRVVTPGHPVKVCMHTHIHTVPPPHPQLMDASPMCDGAAAVVLSSSPHMRFDRKPVEVLASASASDTLTVMHRDDPLALQGVAVSTKRALAAAALQHADIDIFELHDAYSIMACLSLEAAGFAERGEGWRLGSTGAITRDGTLPISTFGGLKARGHPVGATGVYQCAESYLQLLGLAGENQVPEAEVAMLQNIGGAGSSVFTHILAV